MSARLLTRPTALATAPVAVDEVPARIVRRAELLKLAGCDVCGWPIHPVVLTGAGGGRPRHPGCVCCVCGAPLRREQLEPGVVWHPQCRPAPRPVLTVIGGTAR